MRIARVVAALLGAAAFSFVARALDVPRLDRITASDPSSFSTTLTGAPGAVPGSAWVIAIHVDTGHYNVVRASADGSFSMTLFATPGGTLEIKCDPTGTNLERVHDGPPYMEFHYSGAPALWGTMLHLPGPAGSGLRFGVSGPVSSSTLLPSWYAEGTVDATAAAGGTLRIDGTFRLFGPAAAGQQPRLNVQAGLISVAHADGAGAIDQATFASTLMTPTGLPIERNGFYFSAGQVQTNADLSASGDALTGSFTLSMPIPAALPAGHYRPVLAFRPTGFAAVPVTGTRIARQITMKRAWQDQLLGILPVVRIGAPAAPRFPSTLMVNQFHAGSRGADAVETRGKYSLAPRIAMMSERLVVPRRDLRSGAPLRYSLEPFVPSLAVADRSEPITAPRLLFRFPSGSLTATVRRPDGSTFTVGPRPFVQPVIEPLARLNAPLEGGPSLSTTLRLSTLDPSFDIAFDREGTHVISIDAAIEDVWGTVWRSGGTYEVEVADPLVIEPAFVPGTPFEVGGRIPLHVRVSPPAAADVRIRFRLATATGAVRDEAYSVRTNRFGYGSGPSIILTEPGEYRIDLSAATSDAGGAARAGAMTWGNVIALPGAALVAHGKRGIDDLPEPKPQWFFRKQLGHPVGAGHTFFPFAAGDVQWMTDENQEAGITAVAFHDPLELVAPTLRKLFPIRPYGPPSGYINHSLVTGEAPLLSLTSSTIDAHADPAAVDYWSYGYRFVERPAVRVREAVVEEPGPFTYWRFSDRYALQSGNGARGDLPNDFKFQFSGLVVRGREVATPQYAIYGSLMVIVTRDDALGTRVTPPFQGNGGGPDGGPLFTLKGRDIDLFFHPTGVRPGTILQAGEPVSFAGHAAPPLPAKVEITVIAPSGRVRTIAGQASAVGFFARPDSEFIADEPGVWKARVKILFDGQISSGAVSPPYPTGDVLGSNAGEFSFYVVPSNAAPLAVDIASNTLTVTPAGTRFVTPGDGTIRFTATRPAGLSNVELFTTTTMPGFILEESAGSSLTYTLDAARLAADFPNLDLRDHDGAGGVDAITVSMLLGGTDASGRRQYFARQIVIQGEELQVPPQAARRKRRGVR